MRATRVEADHGDNGPARTSRCGRTDSGAARTKCRAARGNTVLSVLTYYCGNASGPASSRRSPEQRRIGNYPRTVSQWAATVSAAQAQIELQLTEPNLSAAETKRLERQKAYWGVAP